MNDANNNLVMLVYGNQVAEDPTITKFDFSTRTATSLSPSGSIIARYAHVAGAFDQTMIIFGGLNNENNALLGDTWLYSLSSNTFTQVSTTPSPSPRYYATGSWNSVYSFFVVFGGATNAAGTTFTNELWVFDGASLWAKQTPTGTAPSARFGAVSVITDSGLFVVFGGMSAAGALTDTYICDFNANTWTQVNAPNAQQRIFPAAGFARFPSRMVVFGDSSGNDGVDVLTLDSASATTAIPTTAIPTTAIPTTAVPTTAIPTTAVPTTAIPTTAIPTTGIPTTSMATTAVGTTGIPTTSNAATSTATATVTGTQSTNSSNTVTNSSTSPVNGTTTTNPTNTEVSNTSISPVVSSAQSVALDICGVAVITMMLRCLN